MKDPLHHCVVSLSKQSSGSVAQKGPSAVEMGGEDINDDERLLS